jgi:hypothetical protein
MSNIDQVKLEAMSAELAKDIKTQADLANLSSIHAAENDGLSRIGRRNGTSSWLQQA